MRRKVLLGVGGGMLAVLAYLALAPVDAEPFSWESPPCPAWTSASVTVEQHLQGEGEGPEDVAIDASGRVYTGYVDGRIVRFDPGGGPAELFATLPKGRPLGMEFDAEGRLIVADGHGGLVSITPAGDVSDLVAEVEGEPLVFADDLDVAPDGTIWFSEASRRWSVHDATLDAVEGVPTGRLIAYDPKTQTATVRLRELRYANGVAVTPDGSAVLVAETFGYRVTRLWLDGPREGEVDRFAQGLPGMPDNVQIDDDGRVWVALIKERSGLLDALGTWPKVRKALFRVPRSWLPVPPPIVWFAVFDADGERLGSYRAEEDFGDVTSVNPHGDHVWLGSLTMDALGRIEMPTF